MRVWVFAALLGLLALLGCSDSTLSTGGSGGFAAINGRVLDATGQPVSGAVVRVRGTSVTATSAANGRFSLGEVPAGNYTVTAEIQGGAGLLFGESQLFAVAEDPVDIGDLTLRTVGQNGNDIGQVTGFVIDDTGDVVVNAALELTGPTTLTTESGAQGGFAFRNVPPGTYTLTAQILDSEGVLYRGVREVIGVGTSDSSRLQQNANVVVAPEARLGSLQGRVALANGDPVAGARVATEFLRSNSDESVAQYATTTNAAGDYLFGTVPAVQRGVRVTVSAGGYGTEEALATPRAGTATTVDFTLAGEPSRNQFPPEDVWAIAFTYPIGGVDRAQAAAIAARHRRLGGRLARLEANRSANRTRLAPTGSQIEIDVNYTPDNSSDSAGQVLYRSLYQSINGGFLPVARSDSPNASLLADLDQALSVRTLYYYRLTTIGAQGNESEFSEVAATEPLDVLQATEPRQSDAGLSRDSLQFRWTRIPGARGYQVVLFDEFPGVDETALFVSDPLSGGSSSYVYDGPTLAPNEDYYWFVVGFDEPDPGDAFAESYSGIRVFTTGS